MKMQLHFENGRSCPAFNVKCYNVPADPSVAKLFEVPEDQLQSMRDRAYDQAQASFWDVYADLAVTQCGFKGCYSQGRMSGWLIPFHGIKPDTFGRYADPEEDAAALDKLGDLLDEAMEAAKENYVELLTDELNNWKAQPAECFTLPAMEITLGQQGRDNFTVTYGKQVNSNLPYGEACAKLGKAILHALACEGKLDND